MVIEATRPPFERRAQPANRVPSMAPAERDMLPGPRRTIREPSRARYPPRWAAAAAADGRVRTEFRHSGLRRRSTRRKDTGLGSNPSTPPCSMDQLPMSSGPGFSALAARAGAAHASEPASAVRALAARHGEPNASDKMASHPALRGTRSFARAELQEG